MRRACCKQSHRPHQRVPIHIRARSRRERFMPFGNGLARPCGLEGKWKCCGAVPPVREHPKTQTQQAHLTHSNPHEVAKQCVGSPRPLSLRATSPRRVNTRLLTIRKPTASVNNTMSLALVSGAVLRFTNPGRRCVVEIRNLCDSLTH